MNVTSSSAAPVASTSERSTPSSLQRERCAPASFAPASESAPGSGSAATASSSCSFVRASSLAKLQPAGRRQQRARRQHAARAPSTESGARGDRDSEQRAAGSPRRESRRRSCTCGSRMPSSERPARSCPEVHLADRAERRLLPGAQPIASNGKIADLEAKPARRAGSRWPPGGVTGLRPFEEASRGRAWSPCRPMLPQRAQPRAGDSNSVPAVNAPERSSPSIWARHTLAW